MFIILPLRIRQSLEQQMGWLHTYLQRRCTVSISSLMKDISIWHHQIRCYSTSVDDHAISTNIPCILNIILIPVNCIRLGTSVTIHRSYYIYFIFPLFRFLPHKALCALRGIATVSRLSVRPSLRDVDVPLAYMLSSKVITWIIILGWSSLLRYPTSAF